jgi:hypothetical protein
MPELNREWVLEQLEQAKVKVASANTILKLLETWEGLPKLSAPVVKEVLEVLPRLILGQVVVEEESDDDYTWVDLQPGSIAVGDVVRVKADAFTEKLGTIHNGRRGGVVGVRYGDVIFKDTDSKAPVLNGVHYSPYKLEKRVKKAGKKSAN